MIIESTPLRKNVTNLYNSEDYDGIGHLEDIKFFELRDHAEDTRNRFGCVMWIFGGDKSKVKTFTSNPISPPGFEQVNEPKEGDLVTYFIPAKFNRYYFDIEPAIPTHSGIYVGNGRVRSKFRESHVYEHPLEAVPLDYGSEVLFFRPI